MSQRVTSAGSGSDAQRGNAPLVLVVGGYGVVGRRLGQRLGPAYPGRIVLAGRSLERAQQTAEALGGGARGRAIDVHDSASIERALEGVECVVSCVDQSEPFPLLASAVARGVAYTDLTASSIWKGALALRTQAEMRGACVVLAAGLVPGISSVMARAARDRLGRLDSVETALLLGVGDAFGPASLEYLFRELTSPMVVWERGRERTVPSFSDPRVIEFPLPVGRRMAWRAPFADQHFFPRSLGVSTAATRLALEPAWMGPLIAWALRAGARRMLQREGFRRLVRRLTMLAHGRHLGADRWALVVEAQQGDRMCRYLLAGRGQAQATAEAAALLVRLLVDRTIQRPGVWFAEEVVEPAPFLEALRLAGLEVTAREAAGLPQPDSLG